MAMLFEIADRYIDQSDWKTIAVLKFCLLSLGIAVGMGIPGRYKKPALAVCAAVFAATYPPLMIRLFKTAREMLPAAAQEPVVYLEADTQEV